MTPRYVYHRPSDMFVILTGVDSKSRATVRHPHRGFLLVPTSEVHEAYPTDVAALPPIDHTTLYEAPAPLNPVLPGWDVTDLTFPVAGTGTCL